MSVLIKGIEMPTGCWDCIARRGIDIGVGIADGCEILKAMIYDPNERLDDCPLVHHYVKIINRLAELEDRFCNEPQTHGDCIRAKSDEELAEFFGTLPCCPPGEDVEELCFPLDSCEGTDFMVKCWLKWLRQEATQ